MSSSSSVAKAALPYAEALFESSQSMKLIDKTSRDLNLISKTIEKSSSLKKFLANPLVIIDAKKNVLNSLFTDQVSSHVLNFLSILIDRRRIILLSSIITCYLNLVYQLQLVTLAEIYTAVPLSEIQKKALQDKLQLMTNSKDIRLIMHINTDLIGGFIVKIGSKVIDMSIYGQLNQISSYLNGAIF